MADRPCTNLGQSPFLLAVEEVLAERDVTAMLSVQPSRR
jgi:hypothetical protein